MTSTSDSFAPAWHGDARVIRTALLMLALSALTGVGFRLVALGVIRSPWPLEYIRHAHSHLVIFGWAIPAMFVALGHRFRPSLAAARGMGATYAALFGLALASWPLFLVSGYQRTVIGNASLPLSVMVSGLGMLAWYAWVARFVQLPSRRSNADVGEQLASMAVAFLVASSAGAWGVAVAQALGSGLRTTQFLTHAFLHLLTLGFMGLGALAVLIDGMRADRVSTTLVRLCGLGVLLSMLGATDTVTVPVMQLVGRIGLATASIGTLALLARSGLGRQRASLVPLLFVLAKSGAELTLAAAPSALLERILDDPSMRVLYLHITLVGFASITLIRAILPATRARLGLMVCLAVVAISLLPVSSMWPVRLGGAWTWWAAAWAGLAAAVAATVAAAFRSGRIAR